MKQRFFQFLITACACVFFFPSPSSAHEIYFCGERIPLNDKFIADKLMNIIKKQISYGTIPLMKRTGDETMKVIEYYLDATGLPQDFKYLAIVESGLKNVVSPVGAAGFWQLMPKTAIDWGLDIYGPNDERTDIRKATHAACKELARTYLAIRKKFGISSWVLTAAAYNVGITKISKEIGSKRNNYFEMDLNQETAEYVYKIIAVKELYEYPELYMKNLDYNIFNADATPVKKVVPKETIKPDVSGFGKMTVKVDEKDGNHPDKLDPKISKAKPVKPQEISKTDLIWAHINGKYDDFKDGGNITIELDEDMDIDNTLMSKGNVMNCKGWIVDDKIFIDLRHGPKLLLIDINNKVHDGIARSSLRDKERVMMKVIQYKN